MYNNILVFMPSWIGDTVMALPAVDRLREAYPHSRIDALARSWVAKLLEAYKTLDKVWFYEAQGRYRTLLGMAASIRNGGYDLAVLMPNSFRAALLSFLGGIPVRAGYRSDGRGLLLTHSLARNEGACSLHMVEYYLEILRAIGLEPVASAPRLAINDEQRLQAARIFEQKRVDTSRPLVGLLPGAQNSDAKMWLSSRFARVADLIVQHFGASVVFFGGSGDLNRVEEVRRQMHEPSFTLVGTGPMHVAAAVGTPVVAIFSSTDPRITAPYSGPCSIIQANVPCAPCGKRKCDRNFECMKAISVDDVLRAVAYQITVTH
ncbi:MAG: glycosyltransferase family 9 protein [Deltaproteobacteria bacterium]|nr:glycosyltransferase family 9 protein [Deltaproteobacteria bacterium]